MHHLTTRIEHPLQSHGPEPDVGMPRSEWVTLYEKDADIERGIASMERVLDDFPLLRGRLVKRGDHLY